MAATRLFRMARPLGLGHQPCSSFSSSSNCFSTLSSRSAKVRCFIKGGAENLPSGHGHGGEIRKGAEVKASVSSSECLFTPETKAAKGVDLVLLLANVRDALRRRFHEVTRKSRPWKLYLQTFIEKGIVDCRFFTLFAVAGSLLGSLLCYVEGCFVILESYSRYFHAVPQGFEQGHVVQLLIEAIDMFLVATAMLVFGMGLHILFVRSSDLRDMESLQHPNSNYLKTLPSCVGMNSIMQAKTKIGQAVVMILQVGVLEKFKSIPLVTCFDLACFAGAVFLSSACIFLLSKLSVATVADGETAG